MKTIIIIIVATVLCYFIYSQVTQVKNTKPVVVQATVIGKPDLNVIIGQDVSGSIRRNGVELICSKTFAPYFQETARNINLFFGPIASSSAKKLIHVYLPAATFKSPAMLNLGTGNIVTRKALKQQYINASKKYVEDSTAYYSDRNKRIALFSSEVDSIMALYNGHLTTETDLATMVSIAEKTFNYTGVDSAENFLLLNSDGQDSFGRRIKKFNGKAAIILTNSSAITHTSIDKIVTLTLATPEQAILYSLNH